MRQNKNRNVSMQDAACPYLALLHFSTFSAAKCILQKLLTPWMGFENVLFRFLSMTSSQGGLPNGVGGK